ncbi:MAG: hypothetical protein IJK71_13445 [Clostridia bacterium]|nr:hypothetical protein [Clostridia bacterium]
MKKLMLFLIAIIMLFPCCISIGSAESLFDQIMSQPDAEKEETAGLLDFDDFMADFTYYCDAWGATFDPTKKKTVKNDGDEVTVILDSVMFVVGNGANGKHPLKQVSVLYGSEDGQITYNETVKIISVIASLDYERPGTAAERSSLLTQITDSLSAEMDSAVRLAQMGISLPLLMSTKEHSYLYSYSEETGYAFVAVINTEQENDASEEESEAKEDIKDEDKIPVEIVDVAVGKNAGITVKNNRDWIVTEVSFRIRYYDKDGKYILTDNADDPVNNDIATLTIPIDDGGLIHRQSIEANATGVPPLVAADRVDLAVSGFKTDEGLFYYTPESDLDWYSSESGYLSKWKGHITQKNYFDEWFADGKQFSLGIIVDYVYPEFEEFYGVDQCGYLITKVTEGSILDQKGVQPGDVLYKCNDWLWSDDPLTIDRAKHELIGGKDMTLLFARGKETITVIVTPEDIRAGS